MADQQQSGACRRWRSVPTTDSPEGKGGVVDHYARHLLLASREDTDSAFRLLEERLLTYDIFPPALMKSEVCSGDGRVQPGATIVQRVAIGPFRLEAAVRVRGAFRVRPGGGACECRSR